MGDLASAAPGDRQILSIFPDLQKIGVIFETRPSRMVHGVTPMKMPSVELPSALFWELASHQAVRQRGMLESKAWIRIGVLDSCRRVKRSLLAWSMLSTVLLGISDRDNET